MRRVKFLIAGLALAGLIAAAAGCSESEGESDPMALLSSSSAAVAAEASAWIPDISEITTALGLTVAEAEALETALDGVREKAGTMGRGMHEGRRGGRRGHGFGQGGVDSPPDGEPPFFGFLEACSEILEPAKFAELLNLMAERHEAHRDAMAEHRGERPGRGRDRGFQGRGQGPRGAGRVDDLAEALDLTDEQRTAVQGVFEDMHEALQEHRQACRDSETARGEGREQAQAIHEEFREELKDILTAEQLEQMDALREEHRTDRQEDMQARAGEHMDRAVEFMTRILDLDGSQATGIEDIMDTAHEQVRALHEAVRNDEMEREAAHEQGEQIRDESVSAIRGLLNEDQAIVFEALSNLLPHHGAGFGHGPARGFRGSKH